MSGSKDVGLEEERYRVFKSPGRCCCVKPQQTKGLEPRQMSVPFPQGYARLAWMCNSINFWGTGFPLLSLASASRPGIWATILRGRRAEEQRWSLVLTCCPNAKELQPLPPSNIRWLLLVRAQSPKIVDSGLCFFQFSGCYGRQTNHLELPTVVFWMISTPFL